MAELIEGAIGLALVIWILNDVFQSVVVPRPTPGIRPTTILTRLTWPMWRRFAELRGSSGDRERVLGQYAPLLLVALLGLWILGLIFGYGLVLLAMGQQVRPVPTDVFEAAYFAGTSLLTIGFGDVVGLHPAARAVAILAGATGLGVVALSISFIFSLFASFQRREALVVTLDQRAGAPPSGVHLLETMAHEGMRDDLARLFAEWERWAGEVLDTHVAYPILAFFRSSHDNESWIGALGAVLDAATLVMTTVEDAPKGAARMLWAAGNHLVEDVARLFRLPHNGDVGVERSEFEDARGRLAAAGYRLADADASWDAFSRTRSSYASALNALARQWAVPPALWVGDRSPLPRKHAER